jgi:serine O-acetyltransferase
MGLIARTVAEIRRDVAAAHSRDPAARGVGSVEILAIWPGVHALLAHRIAHALHHAGVPFVPRLIAAIARSVTGIEIHPDATIGTGFFIDHGMGGKRHPTVQDNVTIGSGAKLLGPITVGHGSKVGANSVVIHDVPPNSTVVGNPGHPVRVEGRRPEGPDADWVHLPDPIADAIKGLSSRITALEQAGDGEARERAADVRPLLRPTPDPDAPADSRTSAAHGPGRAVGPNPAGG